MNGNKQMVNPFVAGKYVLGENFADREDDIRELQMDILSGQNVIIYSPRRFGKTSLILETVRRLENRVRSAYVNLYEVTSLDEIIVTILRQLYTKTDKIINIIKRLSEKILARLIGGEIRLFGAEDNLRGLLIDLLDYLDKTSKQKKVVIILDEFQEISNIDPAVPRLLKGIIDRSRNIVYIFSGSVKSILDLFKGESSPLYNIGKLRYLSRPSKEKMVEFIISKFEATGIKIDGEIATKIVEITDNIPYYTQLLCHEIWNIIQIAKRKEVRVEDIDTGLEKIINNNKPYYEDLLSNLPTSQRKALRILLFEKTIYSNEVLQRYRIGQSTLQKAISGLVEKRIIWKQNNRYKFLDPIFKRYLMSIWRK